MRTDRHIDETSLAAFEEVARWVERRRDHTPFLLGIGGPGGCGKTTLTKWLLHRLKGATALPLDDFRLPRSERAPGVFGSQPDGNDLVRLKACLSAVRKGESFRRPTYDNRTGEWGDEVEVPPAPILLCDGEISAHDTVRGEFDALILVEAHWRTQLNTRLTRDLQQRGGLLEKAIEVFLQSNLRDYPTYAKGASAAATFILYRNCKGRFGLKKQLPQE